MSNSSQYSNPTAPIHKLNFDVLWKVFCENTDISTTPRIFDFDSNGQCRKNVRPLTTLRRSSHVCREWRAIILGSPTLWGRVIELDLLQGHHKAPWRREVVARARSAPLHITGTIRMESLEFRLFLKELLDKHWPTICRLAIMVAGNYNLDSNDATIWDPIQRPAPLLEIYQVSFEWSIFPIFLTSDVSLFADSAPVLRNFVSHGAPKPQFSLQSSWLGNLRTFVLSPYTPCFTATEFINALSNMLFLENLELENSVSPADNGSCQIVSLTSLRRLVIVNRVDTSLFLLKFIIPSTKCVLVLKADQRHEYDAENVIGDMRKEILRYSKSYLAPEQLQVDSLGLEYGLSLIRFAAPKMSRIPFSDPDFSIFLHLPSSLSSAIRLLLLTTLLDSERYTHMKTFQFLMGRRLGDIVSGMLVEPAHLTILGSFFSSLSSVTQLEITVFALEILFETQKKQHDTFPALATLVLENRRQPVGFGTSLQSLILGYLRYQLARGRALAILDITDCIQPDKVGEWSYLEDFVGLRVIWGNKWYLCGSRTAWNIGQ